MSEVYAFVFLSEIDYIFKNMSIIENISLIILKIVGFSGQQVTCFPWIKIV